MKWWPHFFLFHCISKVLIVLYFGQKMNASFVKMWSQSKKPHVIQWEQERTNCLWKCEVKTRKTPIIVATRRKLLTCHWVLQYNPGVRHKQIICLLTVNEGDTSYISINTTKFSQSISWAVWICSEPPLLSPFQPILLESNSLLVLLKQTQIN